MKLLKRIQKAAIAVGMIYGFWLGCQTDATAAEYNSAFVIVALVIVITLSLFSGDFKEKENSKKRA